MKHSVPGGKCTPTIPVEKFVRNISNIDEHDYGDFMRQANVYLNELRDDCHKQGARDTDSKINQMQLYLQFVPNWNVDQTFAKLLNDASYVDDLLKGHWQDWEAVVTEVVSEIGQIVTDVKELRRNSILNYFF